jgi:hypothetical protein
MYIKGSNINEESSFEIITKCPVCGNSGTFDILSGKGLVIPDGKTWNHVGLRLCPNRSCRALLFFWKPENGPLVTFPSLRIDFNSENLPDQIRSSFEESIICHAEGCYTAAAIMVRRTLEEICENKGSKGQNLKQRIEGLQSKVILPAELFQAMDELRLLGNDAAHIESKEYEQIGKDEVAIAIELTKEILKSVYQMDSLVSKLKKLKKNPPSA